MASRRFAINNSDLVPRPSEEKGISWGEGESERSDAFDAGPHRKVPSGPSNVLSFVTGSDGHVCSTADLLARLDIAQEGTEGHSVTITGSRKRRKINAADLAFTNMSMDGPGHSQDIDNNDAGFDDQSNIHSTDPLNLGKGGAVDDNQDQGHDGLKFYGSEAAGSLKMKHGAGSSDFVDVDLGFGGPAHGNLMSSARKARKVLRRAAADLEYLDPDEAGDRNEDVEEAQSLGGKGKNRGTGLGGHGDTSFGTDLDLGGLDHDSLDLGMDDDLDMEGFDDHLSDETAEMVYAGDENLDHDIEHLDHDVEHLDEDVDDLEGDEDLEDLDDEEVDFGDHDEESHDDEDDFDLDLDEE